MAEEKKSNPAAPDKKSAAKPKKEKPPALEDKPFAEFIQQDYIPALQRALAERGIDSARIRLAKEAIQVTGLEQSPECWQLVGQLDQNRRFNLYFLDESIQGQRAFSCSATPNSRVTLESFLIDERKITLDLLVLGLIKRLNGQKWLSRN